MALGKSINTDFGVDATYWNIGACAEDFKNGGVEVTLYGYANEQSRLDGKQPMSIAKVQFTGDRYTPDCSRAELYEKIKQHDVTFADALDLGEDE